jgi:MoaA/NifB/PqqE/SkfB family radical SAM enzyme
MSHLEETVKRIEKWFTEGEKQEPTKVDTFFTERCNLKCRFCNYSKISLETIEQEMSDEKILRLIDEICEMKIKIFGVLGGEPFLRKEVLLKNMEKIKKHGINGSIVTNGTLLGKKDVERIVKIEWDLIRFSIDGLEKIHDNLRGVRGSFDKVMKNIKTFYETKKKLKSNFPTVEINFVLTNKNYRELGKLIEQLSSYEINFVYVLPMIELTEESKHLKISEMEISEVERFLREAEEISKECGVRSNTEEVIKNNLFLYSNKMEKIILKGNKKLPPCFLPWYTMNISSDGSATPCAQWPKSEGIMLNGKSLRRIWFEDFEKMRKKIQSSLPEWCSRCCVPLVDENKEIRKKLAGM